MRFSYSVTGQRGLYVGSAERAQRFSAIFSAEITALEPAGHGPAPHPGLAAANFVLACNLLRMRKEADEALTALSKLLRPDGILFLAEATDDTRDGPNGAAETAEWLAARTGNGSTVQRFEFREPNAGKRTRIFAIRPRIDTAQDGTAQDSDDARVAAAIAANAAKERAANCEFSRLYDAAKMTNPALTYADFAVKREAEHVVRNRSHATLGTAISDRSRKQGRETFEFIKTYLEVRPDSRVVEYGCGSLRVGGHFVDMLAPGHFLGLDVIRDYFDIAVAQGDNVGFAAKDVRFNLIDEDGIRQAEAFGADIVYASAVLFHIHPDDIRTAVTNLKRIASRPGTKLIFDAKITRDAEPARYAQKNGRGGWAWPLWFYQAALSPLELVAQHQHSVYYFHPEVDYALLEFRMPHGGTGAKAVGGTPIFKDMPAASTPATTRICTICEADCSSLGKDEEICPKCRSVARARTVPLALATVAAQIDAAGPVATRRVLGFALPESEMRVLKKHFGEVLSVSLFGTYRSDHVGGLDARDLSRFADASFDCVFGVLLYDYFTEHDQSLADVYRVLKPGGVFMTLIGAYRLRDGNLAPVRASTIKGRPGYFDYMPADSDFASILVGRDWFVEAMRRNGLDGRHVVFRDPVRGDASDWFIGIKPKEPPADFQPSAPAILEDAPKHAPVATRSDAISENGTPALAYSAPVRGNSDITTIRVELSVPTSEAQFLNFEFAEHVRDAKTRAATDTVIMTGTDALAISNDLGKTWRRMPLPRQDGTRLWNCFTTANGRHLVQTLGWQGPASGPPNPEKQGVILTLDAEGRLLGRANPSLANWHGTASIDEANGVLAFGDYHSNMERYARDFEEKRAEYLKTLMPNALWRSTDGGETWVKALEFGPLEIRHFHTVQADPFQRQVWWASSGDTWWESRIWRSADNGATWTEWTNTDPNVRLYYNDFDSRYNRACQRFTDMAIEQGRMIWGSDDFLGPFDKYDSSIPRNKRAGSRLFCSSKLGPTAAPVEIGFVGMPIRKLIDVGPGWIVVTEAKYRAVGLKPQVFFLGRKNFDLTYLFDADNHVDAPTGFTFSKASTSTRNGVFFSHRAAMDVFPGGVRCLRWQVAFE
jgi:SAM-dependent methyltransferase